MITSLNPAFEKITGWSTAEVIGKLFVGLVHPDDVKPAIGHFQRTLRGETTPPFEMRFLMKNGDYRLAEIKVAPPVVANGKIVGIQGIISDITERKRMEESLQASRDYLDKIINSIADPIFVKDRRHCWVLVNDAFCGFIGHGREELLGKSDPDFFPADQVAVFRKKDELVFTTGEEDVNEEQITNADGEIHYIVTKKTLYSDPDGDKFLVGIIRDTSKDKKIQEELRLNYDLQATINGILRASYDNAGITEMLEKVIEQLLTVSWLGLETHGAIFLIENDPHLLVLKAQKGLPELAQAPFNAVPIEKCTCAGTASASGVFADALEGCEQFHYPGIQCNGHYCVPIIVGDKVIGVLNLFLKEHRQRSDRVVEFLHTISTVIGGVIHRKRAEKEKEKFQAQIIQSSKMAAVGQLAAGVAHELNNPLTIIMGNAQFLMNNSACDAPTREIMSEIESASQRCKKIIADLLNFSRMKELQFNLVDINQLVDHVLHLVEYQSDYKNIAVQKSYAAALPQIMVSASHIEQVFLNIVLNAAQAMRNGGSLTITTALSADNKYVNVMFADSGEGVSQEKLSKIFEPFFTTKPKGTGLGLAVSYSIVRQHGGDIKVSSKGAGQGTTFTISFPLKPPS
jgi:PAS domain S-box-containing protein